MPDGESSKPSGTRRKAASTRQPQREELHKLGEYLNLADIMFVALNSEGVVVFANRKCCEVLGYDRDEIVGRNWFKTFLAKGFRKKTYNVFRSLMKGKIESAEYFENPILTKDGKERIISWHNTVMKNSKGQIDGAISSGEDITERKRAENALRESEEKYRTILENIEDGYYEVDLSGSFTFFNKSLCRILGYSKDELMGMNYRAYTDDDHSETVYQTFNKVYRTRKPTEIFDWEVIREDGTRRPIEASISLIVDSTGEPVGFRGIIRDITERKRSEKALQESEQRYKELIDMLPQGVVTADLNEKIDLVNKEMCNILGYGSEESMGRLLVDFVDARDAKEMTIQTARRTQGVFSSYDLRMIHKTGEVREVQVSAAPVRNNAGEIDKAIGVFMDITERKQNEEQRRQQHSELEVYASLIRHDLRNDVGIILGNVDLAKMIAGESDSEILETLSSTEAACERMTNLLKAVSQPSDTIEKNIVALVSSVSSQAQDAHAKLTVNVTMNDDAEELTIVGNRLLPMVFENLLRNAAAHAGEKPIVDMIISQEGSNVQVLVTDNGPGIPKEVRNQLFQRGFSTNGGGLGLYLSREIVNAMNGSIELMDTDPSEGATFKILLPLTK